MTVVRVVTVRTVVTVVTVGTIATVVTVLTVVTVTTVVTVVTRGDNSANIIHSPGLQHGVLLVAGLRGPTDVHEADRGGEVQSLALASGHGAGHISHMNYGISNTCDI